MKGIEEKRQSTADRFKEDIKSQRDKELLDARAKPTLITANYKKTEYDYTMDDLEKVCFSNGMAATHC